MTTLIAKDLRLAYDAFVRWGAVLIAIVIPVLFGPLVAPGFFGAPTAAESMAFFGELLGSTCGITAAWVAVAVMTGDRRHHGDVLGWVMPASRQRQLGAKAAAIAGGCAIPIVVATLCRVDGTILDALALIGSAISGAGFGMGVAANARRTFEGVAYAGLLALACYVASFTGAIGVASAASGDAMSLSDPRFGELVGSAASRAMPLAASLAGIYGAATFAIPKLRRRWLLAYAMLLLFAALAGAIVAFASLASMAIGSFSGVGR